MIVYLTFKGGDKVRELSDDDAIRLELDRDNVVIGMEIHGVTSIEVDGEKVAP